MSSDEHRVNIGVRREKYNLAQDELHVLGRVIVKSHSIVSCPIAISLVCLTSLFVMLVCWQDMQG